MKEPSSDSRFTSNEVLSILEARRYRLVFFLLSIGVPALLGFGFGDLFHGRPLEAFFNFFIGVAIAISLLVLRRTKAVILFYLRVIIFLLGVLFLYNVFSSHQQEYKVLWCFPYPLIVYFMLGRKEGMSWMLGFYAFTVAILLAPFAISDLLPYNAWFNLRFLISLAIVGGLSHIFIKAYEETQQQLEVQYGRMLDSESRYREAYETLKETQSQLIQSGKLAAIGELAAGVAHELNQPLMVIRTNAQLVLRRREKQVLSSEDTRDMI